MAELTIGQRIAQERKKLNISQVGLATRLDVSRQAISKWESDAAIPEIDKLIVLSRLFHVSVGWLLGVEELPAAQEEALSEEQFKIVEELVKKYQMPPKPHLTVFHYLLAFGASLMIFLLMYGRMEQFLQYSEDIAVLTERITALESSVHVSAAPGQLLAGYSFDLYPLTKTKTTHRVKISFSAVPNVWNKDSAGYICINGGDGIPEPTQVPCTWDGSRLAAEVTLDVTDGYELCFAVEHQDGSREQQILQDSRIEKLAQECSIPIKINLGSFSGKDSTITLTDFSANFSIPPIYEDHPTTYPNVTECEYRLYRRPQDDSKYELIRADMMDHLQPSAVIGYQHQVSVDPVQFQNVDLINCNHLRLAFYVKLSSGVEREIPITILVPDGKGGVTE